MEVENGSSDCKANCLHRIVIERNIIKLICTLQTNADVDVRHWDKSTPLHLAIERNDQIFVNKLLERGASVSLKNRCGENALHLATATSNLELISQLLTRSDVNVNQTTKCGQTALHIAVKNRDNRAVELLLRHRAKVDARDMGGNTALHYAVNSNSWWIAQRLLEQGANPNAANSSGNSPFHEALMYSDDRVVLRFLDFGTSVKLKNLLGENALHLACFNGSLKMVKLLLKMGVCVNERTSNGSSPLHYAARNPDVKIRLIIVKTLVEHSANLDCTDKYGKTPLATSLTVQHIDVANYLIEAGANVNIVDVKSKLSPLLISLMIPNLKLALNLLSHGAKVNVRTSHHNTPLHVAVKDFKNRSRMTLVKQLLSCGANVNEGNMEKNTALHLAVLTQNIELIELLIDSGAAIHLRNLSFETPYSWMIKFKMLPLIQKIISKTPLTKRQILDRKNLLVEAVHFNNLFMIKYLLQNGISCRNSTAIITAASKGNCGIIAELLNNGANVNSINPETGLSALDSAVVGKHPTAVQILLQRGANVNHVKNGDVVLSRAVWFRNLFRSRHYEWIVFELLKHIVLLKKQSRYVHRVNWELIKNDQQMTDTVNLFEYEIEGLKNIQVSPASKTTYYDLLTSHGNKLIRLYQDSDVKYTILSGSYKKYGFLYTQEIYRNYANNVKRKQLVSLCEESLHNIFKRILPLEMTCIIASYLNDYEIKSHLKMWRDD